jgi:ADP-heptose:LPS heptosyltransferase
MMLFHFHENYFQSQFSARSMYHEHLGPIWNGDHDTIPPSLLRLSGSELEKGKSSLINRGVIGEYIAVMPEAAWRQKQWRSERYIEVLNKLDMPSVLIGSKIGGICTDIQKGLDHSTDLSGQTSLREAMSIIANAKHVIGSDTGLVHAAEALGKTVSMILGPTSTQTGAGVSLDSSINIEKDLWCRPCSQNGSVPCYRKQQYCMESITPQDVLDSLQIKL